MDISWLGHACIRVRTLQTNVIMDPCDRSSGFDIGRPVADVVTISNPHPHHSHVRGVRGEPLVIEGPGEYETSGVQITGIATYLTAPTENRPPERNTAYVLEAEDLRLLHLGAIGAPLTAAQAERIGNVDVLVLPISGQGVLTPEQAARVTRALEPSAVIPVHHTPAPGGTPEGALRQFIAALGVQPEPQVARASIQRRGLGEKLQLLLLEPRGGG